VARSAAHFIVILFHSSTYTITGTRNETRVFAIHSPFDPFSKEAARRGRASQQSAGRPAYPSGGKSMHGCIFALRAVCHFSRAQLDGALNGRVLSARRRERNVENKARGGKRDSKCEQERKRQS
jgi:hypothetical protein